MLPLRKILHPTDFSEPSAAAFEIALALARDYGAELLALHVSPPPRVFAPDGIAIPTPAEDPQDVRARLDRLRPSDPRVKFESRVLDGDPAEQILKTAKADAVGLIVMGTHGTTGLLRLLMGSVAENVLRQAPCPVLTVRGPQVLTPSGAPATAERA
jgi:nucleotide-binding universal stress UspA family protein